MATNTQIETISTGADKAKLAGAAVLLVGGVVAIISLSRAYQSQIKAVALRH